MDFSPRVFIFVTFLLAATANFLPQKTYAQDASSLVRIEQQNDKQIKIINAQLKVYSNYLASKGESMQIDYQRHLNAMSDSILVLGVGSGVVSSGLGLIGVLSRQVFLKRFLFAGAVITVIALIAGRYLHWRANSTANVAREEMVQDLDADPDPQIRDSMELVMVKQLFDLKEQNREINLAIQRQLDENGRISTGYERAGGIIPQAQGANRLAQTSPWPKRWNEF